MSREYPLELPPEDPEPTRSSSFGERSFPMQAARFVAGTLLEFADWRQQHRDLSQAISAILLLIFGIGLTASSGVIDEYLHRGVESGGDTSYIVQPAGKELSTNVNLVPYQGDGLIEIIDAISGAGFRYVRQEFSWAAIEPEQGQFNFERYDALVEELARRRIIIIAVVLDAPSWAIIENPASANREMVLDQSAFGSFAQQFMQRYANGVEFLQIWDEPNLQTATPAGAIQPEDLASLLASGMNGALAGNTSAKIIFPELAVTSDMPEYPTDLDYLQAAYDAGSAPYFNVLGIQLDGTVYSPDDRRVDENRLNISRAVLFRELMLDNDDNDRPIWATSYGWSAEGNISRETQAEFVTRGIRRGWEEWPWLGLMVQWRFLAEAGTPDESYSIVLPDGSSTPLYERLISPDLVNDSQVAHTGFSPMDSSSVAYMGSWQDQHLEGRTFRTTSSVGSSLTFSFVGTGLSAVIRLGPQVGYLEIKVDGEVVSGGAGEDSTLWDFYRWETLDAPVELLSGLDDTQHTVTITLMGEGELTLGGLIVSRSAPFTWPIMLMAAASYITLFAAIGMLTWLIAVRAGHLTRRGQANNPAFPSMPNWRPTRRI